LLLHEVVAFCGRQLTACTTDRQQSCKISP
jgi:hypothetical protein